MRREDAMGLEIVRMMLGLGAMATHGRTEHSCTKPDRGEKLKTKRTVYVIKTEREILLFMYQNCMSLACILQSFKGDDVKGRECKRPKRPYLWQINIIIIID